MVQVYASSSEEFVRHHGTVGAQRYLRATAEGMKWQKRIAQEIVSNSNPDNLVLLRELGSYYVAYEADQDALRHEYELLQQLLSPSSLEGGDDSLVEWCDRERLPTVPGMNRQFHCAIYFPHDAVIDSQLYTYANLPYCSTVHDETERVQ